MRTTTNGNSNGGNNFGMIDLGHIDELARRLGSLVPPGLKEGREELQQNFKSVLQSGLGRLDLVTREEFDVQRQVLLRTREELPHAVEVEVDELEEREDGLLVVRANVWTETDSQKGIVIGAGGRMVRAIGTAARREIEAVLGRRVFLDLNVRVRRGWRKDEGLLDRLGIE